MIRSLPKEIGEKLEGLPFYQDDVGMSGAGIFIFDEMVLKIQKAGPEAVREVHMLEWLQGRLPVPKVVAASHEGSDHYLLMSRLPGEMACSPRNFQNLEATVKALAKGLKLLWGINIEECPFVHDLGIKLEAANVEMLKGTASAAMEGMYDFLQKNRPPEDLVLTHGDYCLTNVFMEGGFVTGLIDLGRGGVADRWQDIALCLRSLKFNCEKLGRGDFSDYKQLLLEELGVEPDEGKIRYYMLLDELF